MINPLAPCRAIAAAVALLPAMVLAATPPPAGSLELLTGGYPRAFFFRQAEEAAAGRMEFAAWDRKFSGLMGIMGKALDEEIVGRSITTDFFTRFKRAHPAQAVFLHMNGNCRDPRYDSAKFFAGHWLYYNGAIIKSDVPGRPGEIVIAVSDPSRFEAGGGRKGRGANDDVALCRLDSAGRPDWSQVEHAELLSVDQGAKTIRVRRGLLGAEPRSFSAGRAYVAAHGVEEPGGSVDSRNRWLYNFSTTCPRDAAGRNCADILTHELGTLFGPGGRLAAFDGIEFDTTYNVPHTFGKRGRGADCDADGRRDDGVVGGVNVYGSGVIEFYRQLRAVLGEHRLIMADGAFRNEEQQRATGLLNGIESEGWPNLQDKGVTDWSGGLNRQLFWRENGRAPVLSYINHKFNDPGAGTAKEKRTTVPFNITRLVFAAAVCTDSAITYLLAADGTGMRHSGVWDELVAGTRNRPGWLGQPLGPARRLAQRTPNLLGNHAVADLRERLGSDDAILAIDGDAIRVIAKKTEAKQFSVVLRGLAITGPDLFVTLTARGAPLKNHPPEMARLIHAELRPAGNKAASPVGFMSWLNARDFTSGFYFDGVRDKSVDVEFVFESAEPVWISQLAAHAAPDAIVREFEHGLVLANPSLRPYEFDLAALFPGRRFRRLSATAGQDRVANSGADVGARLTLAPKDALFLLAP